MFEITKQPTHGDFALSPKTGHLQYRGERGYFGLDRITYIASDKDGVESLPADVVIEIKNSKDFEKVIEITLEVPVNPTPEDIVDVYHVFTEELEEIINGDKEDDDDD